MNEWNGRRVLVTGATGLLGGHLAETLLARGADVVCLVRDWVPRARSIEEARIERATKVRGELEDLAVLVRTLNEHEIDTVLHAGAQTIVGTASRSPVSTFESNVRGTWNVLEACRLADGLVKRVVVASSDKAYGAQPKLPYVESMPLEGREPYEVSKSCTDLLAQSYSHAYRLPVAILRCGNIYGGGDLNWSRIIPGTIRSFLHGERPIIRSDGRFIRDYLYVKDVVGACLAVADRLDDPGVQGQGFNFSPQKPLTVLEVVEAIAREMKAEKLKPIIQNAATGEIRDQYLSAAKAKRLLGWRAAYTLQKGLAETVDWYRRFLGGPPA